MRVHLRRYLGFAATPFVLALFAGCAGTGSSTLSRERAANGRIVAPNVLQTEVVSAMPDVLRRFRRAPGAPLPSWVRFGPDVQKGQIYVPQFALTNVNEYVKNNKPNSGPLCSIPNTTSVNDLNVDAQQNVWVPMGAPGGHGSIAEFGPNCGAQKFNIESTAGQPAGIAFDAAGNAYVVDIFGASGAFGNVAVYPPGQTSPSTILTDPSIIEVVGVALDAAGNAYISYLNQSSKAGSVMEFPGGQNPGQVLTGVTTGFPGNIEVDSAGNLMVLDQFGPQVDVFAPPYNGAPAIVPLKGYGVTCKLGHLERRLFCADYSNGQVDVYTYSPQNPGATAYAYSFNNGMSVSGQVNGLAPSPAAPN